MTQTHALIGALKRALRGQGLTYRDVGKALELSETSVKRMFSRENFTLERLDQLCQLLGIGLAELVHMIEAGGRQLTQLTDVQEQELASDPRLLVVAFFAANGWTLKDIVRAYMLSEREVLHYLIRLDRLKLIELLPGNRIKLLIPPHFAWRKGGPIERFFTSQLLPEFFRGPMNRPDESFIFLSGMLSRASALSVLRAIEELATQFNELNDTDRHLAVAQRAGFTMVLALRPWRAEVFERLVRK